MKLKLIGASSCLLLGIGLAGLSVIKGEPVFAVASLLCGGYLAAVCLFGNPLTWENPTFNFWAGIIGVLGLVGVFLYNRAFNVDLQTAYIQATADMIAIEQRCRPMSPELHEVSSFGVRACAVQGSDDELHAIGELAKGVHFGPTLTLADSTAGVLKADPPNYCVRAVKAVSKLCPNAFILMQPKERSALLSAAD